MEVENTGSLGRNTYLEVDIMYGQQMTRHSFSLHCMVKKSPCVTFTGAARAGLFNGTKIFGEFLFVQNEHVTAFDECGSEPGRPRWEHTVELIASAEPESTLQPLLGGEAAPKPTAYSPQRSAHDEVYSETHSHEIARFFMRQIIGRNVYHLPKIVF